MTRTDNGRRLSHERGFNDSHPRYHVDAHFFENPLSFPCAFHDPEGYLWVRDRTHWHELQEQGFFVVGIKTNVPRPTCPRGIKDIPGYVWVQPIEGNLMEAAV